MSIHLTLAITLFVIVCLNGAKHSLAARQLRVIDTLGPSTIPPVVVAKSVDAELKRQIQEALVTLHHNDHAVSQLHKGSIERFVPITNEHYQDIRDMFLRVQAAELSFRS